MGKDSGCKALEGRMLSCVFGCVLGYVCYLVRIDRANRLINEKAPVVSGQKIGKRFRIGTPRGVREGGSLDG